MSSLAFSDWSEALHHLRGDKALVLKGVQRNGRLLRDVNEELRADPEVVLAAIHARADSLQFASDDLRANKSTVLEAVRLSGLCLEYASDELKNDREVVLEAIRHTKPPSNSALKFASESCRADKEVVLEAVKNNPWPPVGAPMSSEDLVEAMKRAPPRPRFGSFDRFGRIECALAFASENLRADREVVLAAVECDGGMLRHASGALQADKEVVLAAVKQEGSAILNACRELQQDKDVVLLALRCLRSRAFSASHLAMTQAVVCFPHFQKTFMASVAALGEQAPVATVTLIPKEAKEKKEAGAEERGKGEGADDEEEAEEEAEEEEDFFFRFEVRLMSGATFFVEVSPGTAGGDATAAAQRACPNLNALAQKVVQALPKNSEAPPASRVFINFATDDESDCVTVSPWDWDRPLTDFLPPKIAGKTS